MRRSVMIIKNNIKPSKPYKHHDSFSTRIRIQVRSQTRYTCATKSDKYRTVEIRLPTQDKNKTYIPDLIGLDSDLCILFAKNAYGVVHIMLIILQSARFTVFTREAAPRLAAAIFHFSRHPERAAIFVLASTTWREILCLPFVFPLDFWSPFQSEQLLSSYLMGFVVTRAVFPVFGRDFPIIESQDKIQISVLVQFNNPRSHFTFGYV